MTNIVRPFSSADDANEWPDLIRDYYGRSDDASARSPDVRLARKQLERKPLSNADDIALVDDVLDALMDPVQAKIARPVLRHALKEIARAALGKPQ